MRNFCREYLQGIENVGCRCKICEGSILKSKKSKLQIHWSQKEHLQQRISKPCRYIGPKKSICNSEYQGIADTSDTRKANLLIVPHISITVHLPSKKKTMQSSELESGLPDEAEQECIVFFLLRGRRELNRNSAEIMKRNETPKRLIGEKGKIDFQFTNN